MRTSHLIFIALLVTLWAATPSMADTWADAVASGANPPYDLDTDGDDWEILVWEAGNYSYSYSLYAYATGQIRGTAPASGSSACAQATATVEHPTGTETASVAVDIEDVFDSVWDDDSVQNSGTHYAQGQEVILDFDEYSRAEAAAGNSTIDARARAYTTTSGSVW